AQNASRIFAHQESVVLARRGLEMLKRLSNAPKNARRELALHITLGMSLGAIRGYAASEVAQAYNRGAELCRELGEASQLFFALCGVWACYLVRGELTASNKLARQLLQLAQECQAPDLLVAAYRAMANTLLFEGELSHSLSYAKHGISAYETLQ